MHINLTIADANTNLRATQIIVRNVESRASLNDLPNPAAGL
jgi:hypothetical protein